MIISTSSQNVMLTPGMDEFARAALQAASISHSDRIESVDISLNIEKSADDGAPALVVIRCHLRDGSDFLVEAADMTPRAAIRRGAKLVRRTMYGFSRGRHTVARKRLQASLAGSRAANAHPA